ncbi:MAG TPA: 50S ribosomal protein L23 [Phycisphaerales bacterium]|jgi:large subunit ribosomal protein L23|nr:50S ribosomal protein L23 [Phycisphaerales bacterium]
MIDTTVIKRPLVTEKNTFLAGEFNRYGFEVAPTATKAQIKKAVETLYDVRVLDVATQTRKGRAKRNKYGFFQVGHRKQAVVKVHPEDKIELF